MATAKNRSIRRMSRRSVLALGGSLAVALVAVAYRGPILGEAAVGAAYGARIGCTCRHVGGRELGECEDAMAVEDGPNLLMLSEDEDAKSVTARVPLLASETATYREGWGCILERKGD